MTKLPELRELRSNFPDASRIEHPRNWPKGHWSWKNGAATRRQRGPSAVAKAKALLGL